MNLNSNAKFAIAVTTILALLPTVALTHHPLAEAYDRESSVSVSGTIAQVQWTNPHAVILLDVETPSGNAERWRVEMDPPHSLERRGVDKTMPEAGTEITAVGHASLDCSAMTEARTLTVTDGESFEVTTDASWSWLAVNSSTDIPIARRTHCNSRSDEITSD